MKYTVVEALQKSVYKEGFYWIVKAQGEDGKEYTGDLWKKDQPEVGKNFTADLTMTDWGYSFKKVLWEGEAVKKSYADNRIKYDFTKEEKIEKDKKTNERIQRQGFMNCAFTLLKQPKDLKEWQELIGKLEPVYKKYVETGELDFESLKE